MDCNIRIFPHWNLSFLSQIYFISVTELKSPSVFLPLLCPQHRLTAWKTNAYADEEKPPRHCWKERPLVRGAALGCWRVHGALFHLLPLEYIGVTLCLQRPASGSICCWSSEKRSSFFFNLVLSVFLHHHNHGVQPSLSQSSHNAERSILPGPVHQ